MGFTVFHFLWREDCVFTVAYVGQPQIHSLDVIGVARSNCSYDSCCL